MRPHADQPDADGAVGGGDAGAAGMDPASPDEVIGPANSGRPAAGYVHAPGKAGPPASAGGPGIEVIALLAALAAIALGLLVLLGWSSGLRWLTVIMPGAVPMKANAALLLVLLGTALAVHAASRRSRLVDALAIVALAVASATALEYATGIDLGIDQLLVSDLSEPGAPHAGRMAVGAVIGFGVGALALLMLGRTWRGRSPSAFLPVIVAAVGGLGLLGYAYGAREFTSVGSMTQMAFPATLGFVILSAGLIAADRQHGLMRLLCDPGLAGQLARRLVPTALLLLPLGGWLELSVVQAGIIDEGAGSALMVVFEFLVLLAVGGWTINRTGRVERARAEARRERDRVLEASEDLICAVDAEGRLALVSASWTRHLGHEPRELLGHTIAEFLHPDDLGSAAEVFVADREHGEGVHGQVRRLRARDGTYRWLEWNSSHDPETGLVYAVARDVSERMVAEESLRESEQRYRAVIENLVEGVVVHDAAGRIVASNPAARAMLAFEVDEVSGRTTFDPAWQVIWADGTSTRSEDHPATITRTTGKSLTGIAIGVRHLSGTTRWFRVNAQPLPDASGGTVGVVVSYDDVTDRHRADLEMRRLAAAIGQSADAVVITDVSGAIEYVNPAFEQVSGYTRDEVLGQNPRILKSGVQSPAFYAAMWTALSSGNSFMGDLTNRRKDGSTFQEEVVISPVRDRDDTIRSYVAVKRNVTRERASEAGRERMARERALIARTLADLKVQPTSEGTAELICLQVASLAGIAGAALYYFALEGSAIPLAFVRSDGVPVSARRMPAQRSQRLRDRAEEGPWVEAWDRRPWHPHGRVFGNLSVNAVAYAPLRHGRLIGLLTIASTEASAILRLTESLPALLEFAGLAGALLGPAVADLSEVGLSHGRISQTISDAAFRPVFQPIVDLATGETVGYEALTRFSSGGDADLVFADARAAGLEAELELATLAAAISSAAGLPHGAWLSLNVSPGLVAGNGHLAGVLRRADRPVVLEVTEHLPVDDYAALRAAVGGLRPEVRVAVDDAGAGVANFAHIVELRPAFVKLDIGLVRGIDTDLTRQALMGGLLRFASESDSQTIAEGVETDQELAMLRKLGVPLAQGYLLGRPAPVADWAERVDALSATIARGHATAARETVAGKRAQAMAARETVAGKRAQATAARETVAGERGETAAARDTIAAERDTIAGERDETAAERDRIAGERDETAAERDTIAGERDETAAERDTIAAARDPADADHERARLEKALRRASLDDLTGLPRRKMGKHALTNEIDRARRGDGRFVVVVVDVDALKGVNDRDGHAAGDHVLRTLTATMQSNLRSFDPIVRYGGDEFVCGLGGIDPESVERRFGVIDRSLKEAVGVGISVGLASLEPDDTLEKLIARADAALLDRKVRRGR